MTDPLMLKDSGLSFPKSQADVLLYTHYDKAIKKSVLLDNDLESKVVPDKRESIMEIYTPGEYEVGGVMIRRNINQDFYIIDEKNYRIVYMGGVNNDFDPQSVKNWGDVDVLIVPVGDNDRFINYDKIEKLLSNVDPAVLIPCAYAEEKSNFTDVKSKEEFLKHFGFTNVEETNYLTVTKKKVDEEEQKSVKIICLK